MNVEHDPDLRRAYRCFDRDHARLRGQLLEGLRDAPSAGMPRPRFGILRLRWWTAAAAAALLFAAPWALLFRSPLVVYGIANAGERLSACRSVRVEGWRNVGGVRYPWNVYVEAGRRLYGTTISAHNDDVSTGYSVSDSSRYLTVSHRDKTAVTGNEDALAFELQTRRALQIALPAQLLGADDRGFVKTGKSVHRGVRVDVYERKQPRGGREVVWLDASSGLPAHVAFYEPAPDGGERQAADLDVTANVPPPQDLPTLDPPAGYAVTRHDREPREALGGSGAQSNGERFEILLALSLDGRATLLCWVHYDAGDPDAPEKSLGGPVGSAQPLDFRSPDGKRKYISLHLHDDPWDEGRHARWSLLVPEDGGQAGRAEITITRPNGGMRVGLSPLRFDRAELARVVIEAQKLTLRDGQQAMDLEHLERIAQAQAHSRK